MNQPLTLFTDKLSAAWRFTAQNRKVSVGIAVVAFFVLMAIFGPVLVHQDPTAFTEDLLLPPSAAHWLGTTQNGQDVFAQVVYGSRVSLALGFIVGILTTAVSVVVGVVSGYFGGVIDELFSLVTNVFLVLPTLPLAILLAAFLPYKGPLTLGIVIGVTGWSWGARVMRSQTLSMRGRDFVEAAQARGESPFRIIFFEILPNETGLVAAELLGTVIYCILAQAGLEFIGLGNPSSVSWGTMFFFAQNSDALLLGAWWWFLPPGICIAVLGAALALVNFGIDEIANPRLRTERARKPSLLNRALGTSQTSAQLQEDLA
ncbi:MAG: Chitobiose ABC transporter, permease protein 2 [Ktedonobacterales bacterium]|jgi:peptide/nickel transport system permease protein|nr:MAG: Chitobiose ABC transporter, permease protein 2 [Ktedonobacterales bacterium]